MSRTARWIQSGASSCSAPPAGMTSEPARASSGKRTLFSAPAVQARLQDFHAMDGGYDVVHRNEYDVQQRIASSAISSSPSSSTSTRSPTSGSSCCSCARIRRSMRASARR